MKSNNYLCRLATLHFGLTYFAVGREDRCGDGVKGGVIQAVCQEFIAFLPGQKSLSSTSAMLNGHCAGKVSTGLPVSAAANSRASYGRVCDL